MPPWRMTCSPRRLAAFENRNRFTPGTNFRAWMFRILANKCFVANRETLRDGGPLDDETVDVSLLETPQYAAILSDPTSFLEQCGEEVFRAFRKLSTAQRTCILLKDVEGFSYQEIADIVGIPAPTVVTHLGRGRVRLRKELMEYARREGFIRPFPSSVAKAAMGAGCAPGRATG